MREKKTLVLYHRVLSVNVQNEGENKSGQMLFFRSENRVTQLTRYICPKIGNISD